MDGRSTPVAGYHGRERSVDDTMSGMGSTAWLVLCAALAGVYSAAAIEEISDARDLTFKIKTNDALVVGIFAKKGSAQEGEFRQVAKDLAPDGGILFAVTYDKKVASKYLDGEPPAVAAFTNFDPETGHSKKHVKGKAFTTDFDYAALYKWAYAEALPCVTRIPINMGPDASKRNRIAMSGGLPKLFRFSKSVLGKDPEAQDADGAFLRAMTSAKMKGKATILGVEVQGGEHDEGLSYLENMGYDEDEIVDEPKLVMVTANDKDEYDGAADDEVAIAGWAERAVAAAGDWNPTAGPSIKKAKKKSKKKKNKSEL